MVDVQKDDQVSAIVSQRRPQRGIVVQVGKPGSGYAGFAQVQWRDGTTSWRMVGGLTLVRRPVRKIKEEEGTRS